MSYLMKAGDFAVSPEEVRMALGLRSTALDGVIAAYIASTSIQSPRVARREVWAIPEGVDVNRYGVPVSVGEPAPLKHPTDKRLFRICVYEPEPEIVAEVFRQVVATCRAQHDIHRALMQEGVRT